MSNAIHGVGMDVFAAILGVGIVTINLYIFYFWHQAKKARMRGTSTHRH